MLISRRIEAIEPSQTMAIDAKAKEMKRAGVDLVDFGAGEPDFDTPGHIKQAAIRAIEQGFTKYTPATGMAELKEAICEKLRKENGLEYSPADVVVSCGAKHSILNVVLALVDEGEEVIIPAPYWVSYPQQVKMAGGKPVIINTDMAHHFKLTPDQLRSALTPRTKLLILNSPSNPTGTVYTREELNGLAEVVLKAGIYVISDEVYEKIIYDGLSHFSIACLGDELKRRTIVVNGVSKSYSMTGWRIGYAAGPPEVMAAISKIQSHHTSNPTSISQVASLEALRGPQECVEEMVREFDRRRRYIVQQLNQIPGVICPQPQGAFYVFPDVSSYYGSKEIMGSISFSEYLLEEVKVAVVPGIAFGADAHIRISYATSMEQIQEGVARMKEGLGRLTR